MVTAPATSLPRRRPRARRRHRHPINALVAGVLESRLHPILSESTVLLTYSGWRSGRSYTLPVTYAEDGADLVIVAGSHRKKVWWRNFTQASDVHVLLRGTRLPARARRVLLFDAGYEHDLDLYRHRFPRARVATGSPVIRVHVGDTSGPSNVREESR